MIRSAIPFPALPGACAAEPAAAEDVYRHFAAQVREYAILLLDAEGRIGSWNLGAEHILRYPAEAVVGAPLARLYPGPEAQPRAERHLRRARLAGHCEAQGWRVRGDGRRFWATMVTTALRSADGGLLGYGLIVRDLTDRKRLARQYEEKRQRYRSLFEHNPAAICSLDLDGTLRGANAALLRLAGCSAAALPRPLLRWLPAREARRVRVAFLRAAQGVPGGLTTAFLRGGERVPIEVTLVPVTVARRCVGVYAVLQDVSERAAAQAAREAALRRERQARAAAEAASRARGDLLALVGHELRTPLNAICGFADLLRDGDAGALSDVQRAYLGRIRERARDLERIIDDILRYSRVDEAPGTPPLRPLDLGRLVERLAHETQRAAGERGLALELRLPEPPVLVLSDAERLGLVVQHLLSNALKFTERGGVVRLSAARAGDAARLLVEDTGIGIAPEQLPLVWEPFWQAERGAARRAEGSGMGLSIVQRLCAGLGAEVALESVLGQGTCAALRLPLATP